VLAGVQEPRERLASCARRRPGSSLEDAGSIPATSTVQNAQADGWAFMLFGLRVLLQAGNEHVAEAASRELKSRSCGLAA
jgi:hypothetical protein